MPASKQVLIELLQQSRFLVNYKRLRLTSKARRAVSNALFQRQRKQFEKELTASLAEHFSQAVKAAMKQLTIKAGSLEGKTAKQIVDAVYDSAEWHDDLVNRCLPVMAKHMSEAAAGFFLTLGIDPRRKKSVRVKSTATDWLDSHEEAELPPGVATDLPLWMQEEISNQLQDTFSQPYWMEIDETTRNDIQSVLDNGLRNGVSIRDMAKAISESSPDYSLRRGRLVARTESGHALNGARDAAYTRMKNELPEEVSQHINKSWLSVLGNTTRDAHADLDGTEADENGMFNLNGVDIPWPGHVSLPAGDRCNCLPGFVKVAGTFNGAMRSWYEGAITKIIMSSGRTLTVTPNHPVMTTNGFVPAGMLNPGDEVIAYDRQVDCSFFMTPCGNQVQDEPVPICKIFDSFRLWSVVGIDSAFTEFRSAAITDFHGDGKSVKGYIEIVRPNWELLLETESMFAEKIGNFVFLSESNCSFGSEPCSSSSSFNFNRIDLPSTCDPRLFQSMFDIFGRFVITPSGKLAVRVASNFDASLYEAASQQRSTMSRFLADALKRFPRLVLSDKVCEIRNDSFSGHVYDLQSPYGWIAASDDNANVQYILSNCQCSLTTEFGSGAPPTEQIEELLVDAPEPTPEEEPAEEAPAQVEDVYDPDALLEDRVNKHPGLNKIVQDILDAQAARSDELEVLANEIGADTLRHSALHDQLAKLVAQRVRGDLSMEEEERLREPLYQEWVKVRKERDTKQAKYDKINDEIRTEALKVMQVSPDKRASFSTSTEDLPGMRFAGETLVKATKEFKQKTKDATEFLSLLTAKRDGVDEIPVTFRQLHSGGRAFAIDDRSSVMAGVYCTGQDKTKIFVHEMGHMLENKLGLRRDVQEFRGYRIDAAGTPTISMREATGINAYAENEKGNEDSFGRVFDRNAAFYAGKMYNDGSTEILSMGLEKMYENPVAFAKADPEYFKFVLGVLRGDL